ncbi:ABC transporter ATP-binding protein [Actinomadura opuntiae]|uniref:ABC transporter ATP-binding protein n=1 Tax=Actinomadura sp. OS1-43 TaxID=604315 RepID=UPI00255AF96D|nr:ABC transporter ATP-binding protein [Actinomadura sp. OS1-43]MDL4814073.1 ABC transporter ATP-binding protein [Actinomadura sp. OS1-43]
MTPPILAVKGLEHRYGTGDRSHQAIASIDFELQATRAMSIVGPSGAGKTTLLRCLTGLVTPTRGVVSFAGEAIRGIPEGVGVVFQDYSRSLFPWLSVIRNVEFPLRGIGLGRAERHRRAQEALSMVGLADAVRKYPWQLSGGMQQRVAIARALVTEPRLLLMDEPFASVDAQTRADLEDLVLTIRADTATSIVVVTHDIDESVYLADTVLVLSGSPSHVMATVAVDLPYPRDQVDTKRLEEYLDIRAKIYDLIHSS